jgi:hypothetical protein
VCRIYFIENHGFDQKKAPDFISSFSNQDIAYFIFDFEFEYLKHRTIKGDVN